jgi:hypothetical protein
MLLVDMKVRVEEVLPAHAISEAQLASDVCPGRSDHRYKLFGNIQALASTESTKCLSTFLYTLQGAARAAPESPLLGCSVCATTVPTARCWLQSCLRVYT